MLSAHSLKEQRHKGASNYLGTANISVVGRDIQLDEKARALFDPGAQVTLVTEELAAKLGCERVLAETPFLINGVEQNKPVYADTYAVIHLKKKRKRFSSQTKTVTFKALIIKQTPWGLSVPYPPASWLTSLEPKMADPELLKLPAKKSFEIILGTNLCVQFLKDIVYKHGGFQIRKSHFGLVLEGEAPNSTDETPKHNNHPFHRLLGLDSTQEAGNPSTELTDQASAANCQNANLNSPQNRGGTQSNQEAQGLDTSVNRGGLVLEGMDTSVPKTQHKKVQKGTQKNSEEFHQHLYKVCNGPAEPFPEDWDLNEQIIQHQKWEREILLDPEDSGLLKDKDKVAELIKNLKRAPDGRVIAKLPKLELKAPLSKNTKMSIAQCNKLKAKFDVDQTYYQKYKEFFDTWIKLGIITKVTQSELDKVALWCELPHHGVCSASKFRVVINGSAREPGKASTGQLLDPGINQLPGILKLLLMLREAKCFVIADVEKAFLQIMLDHPDDYLFIIRWVEKDAAGQWQDHLYRFTRLPWGINTAPFILNAVIRYLYDEYVSKDMQNEPQEDVEKFKELHQTTYADDITIMQDDPDTVVKIAKHLVNSLQKGKMNACKFRSFPADLILKVNPEFKVSLDPYKLLGIRYHPATDELSVSSDGLKKYLNKNVLTKRQAAGILPSIHDLYGWFSPFILAGKVLWQQTEKRHPGQSTWSKLIDPDLTIQWKNFIHEFLKYLAGTRVPRTMLANEKPKRQFLALFTDASKVGLGAALYEVVITDVNADCRLLLSRSQSIPEKQQIEYTGKGAEKKEFYRINKAELNAAGLGVKLLMQHLTATKKSYDEIYGFTDSLVVCHWLNATTSHQQKYIERRVAKITAVLPSAKWRHIDGTMNIADVVSRGCSAEQLSKNSEWLTGPSWLIKSEAEWPKNGYVPGKQAIDAPESKDNREIATMLLEAESFKSCIVEKDIEDILPQIEGKDTWTTYVLRRIRLLGPTATFAEAERRVLIDSQRLSFGRIMYHLEGGIQFSDLSPFDRKIVVELGLKLSQDGLLVSQSRQEMFKKNKDVPEEMGPVVNDLFVLCGKRPEVQLLVRQMHETEVNHGGTDTLIAKTRQRFWIIGVRKVAKKIKKSCKLCRVVASQAAQQSEAPLPMARFLMQSKGQQQAFHSVGLDYLGTFQPFKYAKKNKDKKYVCTNKPTEKWSILVFSCTLTRAIHLELCRHQKIEDFVLAFKRFTQIHRTPVVVYSDNQSTLRAGAKSVGKMPVEINKALQSANKEIKWIFNAPRAPWWGGFYERMMGIIKKHISVSMFQHCYPTEAHLQTALITAQNVINSRPITHIPTDDPSAMEAITPNHFLKWLPVGKAGQAADFDLEFLNQKSLQYSELRKRRQEQIRLHANICWGFVQAFLPELRKFHNNRAAKPHNLKVGDYVLIEPTDTFKQALHKKFFWERAVIKFLKPGRDGLICTAIVERFDLNGKRTQLTLPIQRLYVLEEIPEEDYERFSIPRDAPLLLPEKPKKMTKKVLAKFYTFDMNDNPSTLFSLL